MFLGDSSDNRSLTLSLLDWPTTPRGPITTSRSWMCTFRGAELKKKAEALEDFVDWKQGDEHYAFGQQAPLLV